MESPPLGKRTIEVCVKHGLRAALGPIVTHPVATAGYI
jgi:hypothetical protein